MPYVCGLSEELQAKAKEELREKPEWRTRDIDTLRQMILSNKGIKCRTDDHFLLRFLRARKFDYDRAYNLLIGYLTIRQTTPIIFAEYNIAAAEVAFSENLTMLLPHRDSQGRRILYARPGKWNPDKCRIYDIMKAEHMGLERIVQEEETQINGLVMIADFTGLSIKQATHMDGNVGKTFSSMMEECFPIRLKGLHVVHQPALFSTVFAVIKPFLSEKIIQRLNFHGMDHSSLYKHLSPDVLPEELGGNLGPADDIAQGWYEELRATWSENEWMNNVNIELLNRINKKEGKVKTETVTGTFRKLNVD